MYSQRMTGLWVSSVKCLFVSFSNFSTVCCYPRDFLAVSYPFSTVAMYGLHAVNLLPSETCSLTFSIGHVWPSLHLRLSLTSAVSWHRALCKTQDLALGLLPCCHCFEIIILSSNFCLASEARSDGEGACKLSRAGLRWMPLTLPPPPNRV